MTRSASFASCFFFNDTATTEIYTLSLHDALPISAAPALIALSAPRPEYWLRPAASLLLPGTGQLLAHRSEEHTSELQSQSNLVCRLLLEKKKKAPQTVSGTFSARHCAHLQVSRSR